MSIFVPPSVFGEVQIVFDPPMISNMLEDVEGSDGVWIETGDEVAFVVQYDCAVISDQLTIDSDRDFTIG